MRRGAPKLNVACAPANVGPRPASSTRRGQHTRSLKSSQCQQKTRPELILVSRDFKSFSKKSFELEILTNMNRVLLIFFAVFAFAARSDGVQQLKCYVCNSLDNPDCGDPSKEGSTQPVLCDLRNFKNWSSQLTRRHDLSDIAKLIDVDDPQSPNEHIANFDCSKMNIKLGPRNVTVRSCQTAKTTTFDPCVAVKEKLPNMRTNDASITYCGLCNTDGCNGAIDVAAPNIIPLLIGSLGLMMLQAFRQHFA